MQYALKTVSIMLVSAAAVAAVMFPYSVYAMEPTQWAAHPDCVVYRGPLVDGVKPAAVNGVAVCERRGIAASERLYDLEVAVQRLEAENMQLNARLASVSTQNAPTYTSGNTSGLEARVAALEGSLGSIQQALKAVVTMLVQVLAVVTAR